MRRNVQNNLKNSSSAILFRRSQSKTNEGAAGPAPFPGLSLFRGSQIKTNEGAAGAAPCPGLILCRRAQIKTNERAAFFILNPHP